MGRILNYPWLDENYTFINYYQALGVSSELSKEQIMQSLGLSEDMGWQAQAEVLNNLAANVHTYVLDDNGEIIPQQQERFFNILHQSFKTLGDEEAKASYDEYLRNRELMGKTLNTSFESVDISGGVAKAQENAQNNAEAGGDPNVSADIKREAERVATIELLKHETQSAYDENGEFIVSNAINEIVFGTYTGEQTPESYPVSIREIIDGAMDYSDNLLNLVIKAKQVEYSDDEVAAAEGVLQSIRKEIEGIPLTFEEAYKKVEKIILVEETKAEIEKQVIKCKELQDDWDYIMQHRDDYESGVDFTRAFAKHNVKYAETLERLKKLSQIAKDFDVLDEYEKAVKAAERLEDNHLTLPKNKADAEVIYSRKQAERAVREIRVEIKEILERDFSDAKSADVEEIKELRSKAGRVYAQVIQVPGDDEFKERHLSELMQKAEATNREAMETFAKGRVLSNGTNSNYARIDALAGHNRALEYQRQAVKIKAEIDALTEQKEMTDYNYFVDIGNELWKDVYKLREKQDEVSDIVAQNEMKELERAAEAARAAQAKMPFWKKGAAGQNVAAGQNASTLTPADIPALKGLRNGEIPEIIAYSGLAPTFAWLAGSAFNMATAYDEPLFAIAGALITCVSVSHVGRVFKAARNFLRFNKEIKKLKQAANNVVKIKMPTQNIDEPQPVPVPTPEPAPAPEPIRQTMQGQRENAPQVPMDKVL